MAEFKLTFKKKLKDKEALAPLKEGIKDGRMGSLSVDPESLKVKEGTCNFTYRLNFTSNYATGMET